MTTVAPEAGRERLPDFRAAVERRLGELFALRQGPNNRVLESIRHSLLAPSKRIRPTLTLAAADCFGAQGWAALDPACAIEMAHTASLILDDMPSMDDARLRRGRPANHRVFGEHVATLAAFELLNCAFGTIARAEGLTGELRARLGACLARAVGVDGLIGGQLLDLESSCRRLDGAEVLEMYGRKTGALLGASIEFGALVAGVAEPVLERLRAFSHDLGLAFQILDDLKDRFGSCELIGKDVRQDASKTNFLSYASANEASEEAARLMRAADEPLALLGAPGERLSDVARSLLAGAAQTAKRPSA